MYISGIAKKIDEIEKESLKRFNQNFVNTNGKIIISDMVQEYNELLNNLKIASNYEKFKEDNKEVIENYENLKMQVDMINNKNNENIDPIRKSLNEKENDYMEYIENYHNEKEDIEFLEPIEDNTKDVFDIGEDLYDTPDKKIEPNKIKRVIEKNNDRVLNTIQKGLLIRKGTLYFECFGKSSDFTNICIKIDKLRSLHKKQENIENNKELNAIINDINSNQNLTIEDKKRLYNKLTFIAHTIENDVSSRSNNDVIDAIIEKGK